MPKISVIIPAYNVERYVDQCLESVLAQSQDDFEVICIDDGSTDRSGVLLDSWAQKDTRIKVIHKENTGYGNSMNMGLEHALGTYVAIVESDDFAEPDMLEKLYGAAAQSHADIVKGEYYKHQSGTDTYANRLKGYPKNQVLAAEGCPALLNLADTIWSCLYRRQFLLDNGITFNETPGASFQDISFSLLGWLYAKRVYLIEDAVLHYRIDNPDSSMKNPTKIFCVFDEYKRVEGKIGQMENPLLEHHLTASKYRDCLNHYYRVDAPFQYALLVRLSEELKKDMDGGKIKKDAFLETVWEQINAVYKDRNEFFFKSGKKTEDSRLKLCGFGNDKVYYRGLVEELKRNPEVVIYGAGVIGQKLALKLLQEKVRISCFAVTGDGDFDSECLGMPVVELKSLIPKKDSCAIVVAVAQMNQLELYHNLQAYGFKNIFRVDEILRRCI